MSDTLTEIRAAVAAMGSGRRRAFASALTEHRDLYVGAGDAQMAELWNLLSCLALETLDEETAQVRALEDTFAAPAFDGLQEPPC